MSGTVIMIKQGTSSPLMEIFINNFIRFLIRNFVECLIRNSIPKEKILLQSCGGQSIHSIMSSELTNEQ